jgi:hypothetical protein
MAAALPELQGAVLGSLRMNGVVRNEDHDLFRANR